MPSNFYDMFALRSKKKHSNSRQQSTIKLVICALLASCLQVKALPSRGTVDLPDVKPSTTSRNMLLRVQVSVEIQLRPSSKGSVESLLGNLALNAIDESKSFIVTLDDLDDSYNDGGSDESEESTQLVDSSLQVEQHLIFPWGLFYNIDGQLCVRGNTTLSLLLPIQATSNRNPVLTARTIVVTLWEDDVMTSMSSLMPPKLLARRLANLPRLSTSANNRWSSKPLSTEHRRAGPFMYLELHGTTTFELDFGDGRVTDSENLRYRQALILVATVIGCAFIAAVLNQRRLAAKFDDRPQRAMHWHSTIPDRCTARKPSESSPQRFAPAEQKCNDENASSSTSRTGKNRAPSIKDGPHGFIQVPQVPQAPAGNNQIARWNVPIPQFRTYEPWESTEKTTREKEATTNGSWRESRSFHPQQVHPTQLFLPGSATAAVPTTRRNPVPEELDPFSLRVTPSPTHHAPQSHKSSVAAKAQLPINPEARKALVPSSRVAKTGSVGLKEDIEPLLATVAKATARSGSDCRLRNVEASVPKEHHGIRRLDSINSQTSRRRGNGSNRGASKEDNWLQELRNRAQNQSHERYHCTEIESNDLTSRATANKTEATPSFKTYKEGGAHDQKVISLDDSSQASSPAHSEERRLDTRIQHKSRKRRVSAPPNLESTEEAKDKRRGRRRVGSSSRRSSTTTSATRKRHSSAVDEKENRDASDTRIPKKAKPKKYKRRRLAKADDLLLPDVTASASLASAAQSVLSPRWELGGPTAPPKSKRKARGPLSAASSR